MILHSDALAKEKSTVINGSDTATAMNTRQQVRQDAKQF